MKACLGDFRYLNQGGRILTRGDCGVHHGIPGLEATQIIEVGKEALVMAQVILQPSIRQSLLSIRWKIRS